MQRGANAHWIVEHDSASSVAKVSRTATSFHGIEEMEASFALLRDAFASIDRTRHALLFDIRVGPMKNDPVFERAFARNRKEITSGWRSVVVLVKSAIGVAQVQRHGREDGIRYIVTTDERAALEQARAAGRQR